ncbi:MAG: HD-GYP domain-containing protein [Actinomycetota bacterium]
MINEPTRGASEDRAWSAKPLQARVLRFALTLLPVVVSLAVVRFVADQLWRPDGWWGVAVFVAQIGLIGSITAMATQRVGSRLLPLTQLMNMTLVFPDHAPSRFSVALRARSFKTMQKSVGEAGPIDAQERAEELVAMVAELGRHERLTLGHTERVRAYSDLIGKQLGFSKADREFLTWSALVHDVGKLTVPAEILNLDGRPDDEQWAVLRAHPAEGAKLVEPLADWLGDWRHSARDHHERWDGDGYPNGAAGEDISLAGRIVAVADAYDVITSARSYKNPMSIEAAREELVRCSGAQFDPAVVRALLQASLKTPAPSVGTLAWILEAAHHLLPKGVTQAAANVGTSAGAVAATAAVAVTPVVVTELPALIDPAPVMTEAVLPEVLAFDPTTSLPSTTEAAPLLTAPPTAAGANVESTTTMAPSSTTTATTLTTTTSPPTTTPVTVAPSPSTKAPPATAAPAPVVTTGTAPPPPTTASLPGTIFFLTNPGRGDTKAQILKTLETAAADSIDQANFDTNRDDVPGLSLRPTQRGWGEYDITRIQRFGTQAGTRLDGDINLRLWVAAEEIDDDDDTPELQIAVSDCNVIYLDCSIVAEATVDVTAAVEVDGFQRLDVDLGLVTRSFEADRWLVLRLITEDDETLHVAFDSTLHPSSIELPWR